MSEVKKVAKYGALITILLALNKLTGFLRELLIAVKFGANRETDIFKIASTIPTVLFSCIAAALVTAFIPVFADIKRDKQKADEFFNNILNIIQLICIFLVIIGIIFSPQLTYLFASGFKGKDFDTAVYMTRILMPSIVFLGISGLYTGYLQSYDIFLQPTIAAVAANFIIIAGILIFYRYGIIAAIIATFLGAAAQAYTQRPFMKGYRYRFFIDFSDKNVRRMLLLSVPTIISTAVSQINLMVGRNFASRLVEGSISVYDYGYKISTIINQVFIIAITTVLYPGLTEKYASGDMDGFKRMAVRSINMVLIVSVPLIFGLAALSTPLVKALLEHGKFDARAAEMTSLCLKYLAFGALGYSLTDILSKIFYSIKDTVTPMINGFINVGINVFLIIFLAPRFGVGGLALATTISACLISLAMLGEIKYKIKDIKLLDVLITSVKTFTAGIVMAFVVNASFRIINKAFGGGFMHLVFEILAAAVIGAAVYSIFMVIFRVEEFKLIIDMKIKKKKI